MYPDSCVPYRITVHSTLQATSWSVESVCQWAESVSKQQNTLGISIHPDDLRAGLLTSYTVEPLITGVSSFQGVGIEGFHCIQRYPHFRGLE